MIEYVGYHNYISHNRIFNILFSTTIATLISFIIGIVFYIIGVLGSSWGIYILMTLAAIPIITFIKENGKYEGVIAYHYIWSDIYHGLLDRKVLDKDYGKTHNIYNWKEFLAENHPDGRWNYHVDTKYMEQLAHSRNIILTEIADEYAEKRSVIENNIANYKNELSGLERKLKREEFLLDETQRELDKTPPSAQQYHLQCKRKSHLMRIDELSEGIALCVKNINNNQDDEKRHTIAFYAQKGQIEKDYEIRSNRYARIAIKRIEENGLKYDISMLKLPDNWINNPYERSIK